jgi:hypothetical protein
MCNLQCNGFGQDDPTDPDSWELPYEKIDITDITRVEDLPVFDKGCDSSYTWAKKYKHLMHDKSAVQICDELEALLPTGKFYDQRTGMHNHMVFTGGEPMLKQNQTAMLAILEEFEKRNNLPKYITVETNGTKPLTEDGKKAVRLIKSRWNFGGGEWFWSVSPKLWSTAGEEFKRAIVPEAVGSYIGPSSPTCMGQLKFVVNGTEQSWKELEEAITVFRRSGVHFPVWVMGVGGTFEGLTRTEADIADQAIQRGYNYTSRVHVHIYGNAIGK